jgi:hypothetical protein
MMISDTSIVWFVDLRGCGCRNRRRFFVNGWQKGPSLFVMLYAD